MKLLEKLDLYTGIVLVSLILLPLGGWWVSKLDAEIKSCKRELREATKSGGLIEEIGSLQKKIEVVAQNRRTTSDAIQDPRTYFEGQILAVNASLAADDFTPSRQKTENDTVGRQKVTDHVVTVGWGKARELKKVQMDFVYAVVFNCESGARQGMSSNGPPSVWRLRNLRLVNATNDRDVARDRVPDPELQDAWYIKEMKFARREPRSTGR